MNPGLPAPAAFQDVLAAMAEVDRLKSREELLAVEADLPARVADVTARLKEVYARQGVAVPDHVIAQGVEQFFSQRLVFAPPPPTLGARLAPLWIHRGAIIKIGAALAASFLILFAVFYFAFVVPAEAARERERVAAREGLEQATAKLGSAEKLGTVVFTHVREQVALVRQRAPAPELVGAAEVAEAKVAAGHAAFDKNLQLARAALAPFAPFEHLASDRARPASAGARGALEAVRAAGRDLDQVSAFSDLLGALQAERASLEVAWRRLEHPGLPAALRSGGEQIYARGLAVVTGFGAVAEVRRATEKLHGLADVESALRALPGRIKAAAAEARAISHDPQANEQIAAGERTGLAAVDSAEAVAAEKSVAGLLELTARLGEAYTLRIVNRPREYTRLWRHPNGKPNVKNFYVVVEAVTAEGALVAVKIRSEEDGATAAVTKWAERVDEATYESVGRDKQDDGVIQNNVFGQKEKGRLTPGFLLGPKSRGGDGEAGRINRWEYRG